MKTIKHTPDRDIAGWEDTRNSLSSKSVVKPSFEVNRIFGRLHRNYHATPERKDELMSAAIEITEAYEDDSNLSVAVISPDDLSRNAVINELNECHEGTVREFIAYPPNLEDVPQDLGDRFDIIMIDMDSNPELAIGLVEAICSEGSATVMLYSARPDQEMLVRCMRAGVREFLNFPFADGTVQKALQRASGQRPRGVRQRKAKGELFVFISAKGGAGVTTVSCNYAVSLARESGKRTLLIDLNLPLGDAAINLGVKSQYSTASALESRDRIDDSLFNQLLVRHSSGLFVLTAPTELNTIRVSGDAIDRLVDIALREFDYVVVDAGSRQDIKGTEFFDPSSTVYVVTQIGIPELRNSNRLIAQIPARNGPKLQVVVNRFESNSLGITEEQIEKALTKSIDWKIPNDYNAVRDMQNTATPLALADLPISKSIRQMARSACGLANIEEKKKVFGLRNRIAMLF